MGQLSNEAKSAAARLFIRGKRSRCNSVDHAELLTKYAAGVDELVRAGFVSRRRKPRHQGIYLFRGSESTLDIGRKWLALSVPKRGAPPPDEPERIVAVDHRMVQDPMMTDAEYFHQRALHPGKPNLGRVLVQENLTTRIGGLAYVKRRAKHQEMAAEHFKALYESMYGSGNPAIDAGRVQVDTTIIAHDGGMATRVDRGLKLHQAMEMLGKDDRDIVIAVVVLGVQCADVAKDGARGKPTGRTIGAAVSQLLDALDRLAVAWGFKTA
jgi:hypothetical protein